MRDWGAPDTPPPSLPPRPRPRHIPRPRLLGAGLFPVPALHLQPGRLGPVLQHKHALLRKGTQLQAGSLRLPGKTPNKEMLLAPPNTKCLFALNCKRQVRFKRPNPIMEGLENPAPTPPFWSTRALFLDPPVSVSLRGVRSGLSVGARTKERAGFGAPSLALIPTPHPCGSSLRAPVRACRCKKSKCRHPPAVAPTHHAASGRGPGGCESTVNETRFCVAEERNWRVFGAAECICASDVIISSNYISLSGGRGEWLGGG